MPPGSKKRKAAAKKKKGGANNPNSSNNASSITNSNDNNNSYTPHEHDKDSDGGEVEVETNSPTSEDHHDDAFNETGAEVDMSGPVSVVSLDTETKSVEGISEVGMEENGANKAFEIVEEGKSIDYENKSTNEVPNDLQEVQKVDLVPVFPKKDKVEPEGNVAIEILEGNHQNELVDIAGTELAKESIDYENKSPNEVPDYLQEVKKVEPVPVFTQKDKIEPEGSGALEILESNHQNEVDIACIEPAKESLDSDNEQSNGVTADYKLEAVEKTLEEPDDVVNRTTQLNNSQEHVDLLPEEPIAVADSAPAPESSAVDLGKLEEPDDVVNRTTQLNNSEEHVDLLSEEPIAVADSAPAPERSAVDWGKLDGPDDVVNRTTQLKNSEEHVDLLSEEPSAVADGAPASESSAVDSGEPEASVSEKIIHMVESTPAEDMIASASDLKENGKELPSLIEEVSQVPSSELDCSSNKIKEKVVPTTDETDGKYQGEVAVGKEDKLQPYEGSTTQASKRTKDIGAVESTEQQPSVSLAPRVAQRTSWMSCCGLFEAIMASR